MTFTDFYTPSKQEILNKVTEESIFEHFLNIAVVPGLINSPFRPDSNPSCSFLRLRNGVLCLVD